MTAPATAQVLLVLDYPGRRPEARIADLRLEQAGYDVRYLMQPPLPRQAWSSAYAAELADGLPPDLPVRAVLAYCMAGPLGQELAVRWRCPLLLFDGEPSTPEAIGIEYRKLLAAVDPDDVALPAWWDTGILAERSDRMLKLSEQHLLDRIRRAVGADLADGGGDLGSGQPDPPAHDAGAADDTEAVLPLVGAYLDWMAYLVAAYRCDFPAWPGTVTNFLSDAQPAVDSWPGAGATESVRVDRARNDLLAADATRRGVLDALTSLAGGGPATGGEGAR